MWHPQEALPAGYGSTMSGVARPRGPLPARVYWVRRTLVAALAIGLVVGIARVLGGGSDGADGPAATTVASQPTQSPATAGEPAVATKDKKKAAAKKADGKKQRKKKDEPPPLPEPNGPCMNSDVVVTAKTDKPNAGGDVPITLLVTSKLSVACTFEVSSRNVVLKLTSGADRIWSSQQCPRAIPQVTVVARQDVPGEAQMIWNGQRSDDDCSRQAGWALPGYYYAEAAALGSEPTDVQFRLLPAVRPTITPKPKIKKVQEETADQKKRKKKRDR